MMGTLQPCIHILPPAQVLLWPALAPLAKLGFVLYGGTAIALRLGHRQSVDFDFFTDQALDRDALYKALPFLSNATVLQDENNAFTVSVSVMIDARLEYVKVSFFGLIRFGRIGNPQLTQDGVLGVAALDDLMATKVKVVLQRAEAKDYRDVAAMIEAGTELSRGLATAKIFFAPTFQPSESLKALVYFADGDLHTLTKHEQQVLIEAVSAVRDLPTVQLLSSQLSGDA